MKRIKEFDERIDFYKNNKVVLWGAGLFGRLYLSQFMLYDINIVAVCDSNEKLYGMNISGLPRLEAELQKLIENHKKKYNIDYANIEDIPIISPIQLKEMIDNDENIVVQSTVFIEDNEELEKTLISQFEELGVKKYFMFSENEIERLFTYMRVHEIVDVSSKFVGSSEKNKIRITKIDDKLSIYKNNKVILWGNQPTIEFLNLFKYHKIDIYGFYNDSDDNKLLDIDIPLITFEDIENMVKDNTNIVVQILSDDIEKEKQIIGKIEKLGIEFFIIYNEAHEILNYIKKHSKLQENFINNNESNTKTYYHAEMVENDLLNYINNDDNNNKYTIICSLPKTGDVTLNNTLKKHNISYLNIWHSPTLFDKKLFNRYSKIKMITAIRNPINRDLSDMYQWITNIYKQEIAYNISQHILAPFAKEALIRNNGDAQYCWDKFTNAINNEIKNTVSGNLFIDKFNENIIDIMQSPFDKEKGYTIVKEGNIEVFIYQLEKMNDCVKELAEFVGGDFTEWKIGNIAADKWIADSYKQAQKEIKISQEYFDASYNAPYIKHFYSDEDIEKFKARWTPHIEKNN